MSEDKKVIYLNGIQQQDSFVAETFDHRYSNNVSSDNPLAIKFSSWGLGAQAAIIVVATYMLSTAPVIIAEEALGEKKTLGGALALAIVSAVAMNYVKFMLNQSGALKQPFDTQLTKEDLAQMVGVAGFALGLYYLNFGDHSSPLGFRGLISFTGALIKAARHLFTVPPQQNQLLATVQTPLLQDEEANTDVLDAAQEERQQTPTTQQVIQGFLAMHVGIRLPLLLCALVAGGEALNGVLFLKAGFGALFSGMGLTTAGVVAFSTELNELLGGTLFWLTGWFKEQKVGLQSISVAYPNPVATVSMMVVLAYAFSLSPAQSEDNISETVGNYFVIWLLDVIARESKFAATIDRTFERYVVEPAAQYLFSNLKCCTFQPAAPIGDDTEVVTYSFDPTSGPGYTPE